jgi:hypothetical protein
MDAASAAIRRLGQAPNLKARTPRAALAAQPILKVVQGLSAQALGDPGTRIDHRLAAAGASRPEAGSRLGRPTETRLAIGHILYKLPASVRHDATPQNEQKQN